MHVKHKDYYDDSYVLSLSEKLYSVMPDFDKEAFLTAVVGHLEDKELFARFDCIVDGLEIALKRDYAETIQAFYPLLGPELEQSTGMFSFGWWLWPIGRYVERHGNDAWEASLAFLKELTKRFTGEYAIRPLLKAHPQEVMEELILWSRDPNVHVRRLASEGVRIRLPWSQKLTVALEDFDRYSTILTNLKDDPAKFVQKSVGNNLNDLYKEAPEKADALICKWKKTPSSSPQEWIIKHGQRNQK
ncbi:DNA alkylation repair protein [Enterococcus gilvus]|uniref:DNA alkylation repair protein n=1 Tax=Enterococcus gilvus TaxID=160453 RepID=UPI003D6C63B6